MSEADKVSAADDGGPQARLRDRTDEIELIISGLIIVALFALPGWLLERLAEHYTHLSVGMAIGGGAAVTLISGICYSLAACFVMHLLARAYWIGLIGLRSVFPDGIEWTRTPGIGPLTRLYYQGYLPDLSSAIDRADRFASSLFAVISLIAMIMLWIGLLLVLTMAGAGLIGAHFGLTSQAVNLGTLVFIFVLAGLPILLWLLDAVIGARLPGLQRRVFFHHLVRGLARITGWVFPQRLILPVQLTLQSNTRPVIFIIALSVAVVAIVIVGNTRATAWYEFTLSGEYQYLSGDDAIDGFRSAYYEDMRSAKDRMRPAPMIPAFEQNGSFVRLFIPYWPFRDNLMLERICPEDGDQQGADCLRRLWAIEFNGQPVPLEGFVVAERMDLKMRGLIGLVPLNEVGPGLHTIDLVWNPLADSEAQQFDDRYREVTSSIAIPFLFNPQFERELE